MFSNLDHKFLSIPPEEQPVNHYRLIGVSLFETDKEVIRNALEMRSTFISNLAGGEFSDYSQSTLNRLSEAQLVLTNPDRKREYDKNLTELMESQFSFKKPKVTERATIVTSPKNVNDQRTWVIGKSKECDIVVETAEISRTHCLLTRIANIYTLIDLESTNGTYVNSQKIKGRTTVTFEDLITLGTRVPMPWPSEVIKEVPDTQLVYIGRSEDNHVVLQDQSVSSHHARIILREKMIMIEDLGSMNGTAINSPDNQIATSVLQGDEVLFFGRSELMLDDILCTSQKNK